MGNKRNENIVAWIKSQVINEFKDNISLVLLYGSYFNGTSNTMSDVDCYFIPKTDRGYQFAKTFILDEIGFDIFPMSWERVEGLADLQETLIPCLGDVEILYSNSNDDCEKFYALQNRLKSNLSNDNFTHEIACQRYANASSLYSNMLASKDLCELRTYCGQILMILSDVIAIENHSYYHYGLKKQLEELRGFPRIPHNFIELYISIIKEEKFEDIKRLCCDILESASDFLKINSNLILTENSLNQEQAGSEPDFAELASVYEEIVSTFNKIYVCCDSDNFILAFLSAVCLQYELNTLCHQNGLKPYYLLDIYKYDELSLLKQRTQDIENDFVAKIINGGGKINKFNSIEDIAKHYSNGL